MSEPVDPEEHEDASAERALPGDGTPDGESLRQAYAAFDRGDFRRVRRLADRLSEASDPEVAKRATALRRRVSVDPIQLAVVLGCFGLLVFISYMYVF